MTIQKYRLMPGEDGPELWKLNMELPIMNDDGCVVMAADHDARIAQLEALLDECYEASRAPTSDELDRLKVPTSSETKVDPLKCTPEGHQTLARCTNCGQTMTFGDLHG